MRNRITIICCTLLLYTSCSQDSLLRPHKVLDQVKLIDLYLNLTSPDLEGGISIVNNQGNFSSALWDENNRVTASCLPGSAICAYDEVHLGDHTLPLSAGAGFRKDRAPEYKSLFGQDLSISLGKKGALDMRDGPITISNIYIPAILDVTVDDVPHLSNGYPIQWNADPQNSGGVYILLHYSPKENPRHAEASPENEYNYVHVPDNGLYTFNKSDFPDIPSEYTLVMLSIIRGAFDLPEVDDAPMRILAWTKASGFARVE